MFVTRLCPLCPRGFIPADWSLVSTAQFFQLLQPCNPFHIFLRQWYGNLQLFHSSDCILIQRRRANHRSLQLIRRQWKWPHHSYNWAGIGFRDSDRCLTSWRHWNGASRDRRRAWRGHGCWRNTPSHIHIAIICVRGKQCIQCMRFLLLLAQKLRVGNIQRTSNITFSTFGSFCTTADEAGLSWRILSHWPLPIVLQLHVFFDFPERSLLCLCSENIFHQLQFFTFYTQLYQCCLQNWH